MSTHIGAKPGDIAKIILLPGDPLRAKRMAEDSCEPGVTQFNEVRGMLGFTGKVPLIGGGTVDVSFMGTGMGIPSISIYAEELMRFFGVEILIRVGTCGAYGKDVMPRHLVMALSASTDSNTVPKRFGGDTFAGGADPSLLYNAMRYLLEHGFDVHIGNVLSTDTFYRDPNFDPDEEWENWARYGVLGVEMEAAAIYMLAARYGCKALAIMTASDKFPLKEWSGLEMTSEEREKCYPSMVKIALAAAGYQADL